LVEFFVANFVHNPDAWIKNMDDDVYLTWKGRMEGIYSHFEDELLDLFEWCTTKNLTFNSLFQSNKGQHPIIVRLAFQKIISLETFVILDKLLKFMPRLNQELDDIIWNEFYHKVVKYSPFVSVDLNVIKTILRKHLKGYGNLKG